MKEFIRCYNNKDIKKAEGYFFDKWYKYLTWTDWVTFDFNGKEFNWIKKEIVILYNGENIFYAATDRCASDLSEYVERDLNWELITPIRLLKKQFTLIKWWLKIKFMSDKELKNLIEYLNKQL